MRRVPCHEGGRFRLDFPAESSQEFRNLVFQHYFFRFTELCILLCFTAVDKETIGGANLAVHLLCLADKADCAHLMTSAAGRTAGDMDLRKHAVCEGFFFHPLHTSAQKSLGVLDTVLADGSSDTAYAGFKEMISAVVCDSKYGGNFACGQVDDIEGSVRSETYLSICQVLDGLIESGRFFRRQTSADRMIGNRIKPRLFLFDDPLTGNGSA